MKAFPVVIDRATQIANETNYAIQEPGMDLVDYFAAKAMQSLIITFNNHEVSNEEIGLDAYSIAEKMMEIREWHIKMRDEK